MYVHVRLSGWEGEAPAELRKKLSGWEGEAPAELRKKLGRSLLLPLLGCSAGASFSRCRTLILNLDRAPGSSMVRVAIHTGRDMSGPSRQCCDEPR